MFGAIIVAIVVAGLPVLYIIWRIRYSKFISAVDRIPGPETIPVFGNALQFGKGGAETYRHYVKLAEEYPSGINRTWLGTRAVITVYKAEYLEPIMSGTTNIKKSVFYKLLEPWLGEGLLTSFGAKWQARRKMLTPTFHYSILDSFMDIFDMESQKLIHLLEQRVDGPAFEMHSYITHCSLDIICQAAMGVSVNAQEDTEGAYVTAIYRIGELIMDRVKSPANFNDFVFSLTKLGRDHNATLKVLHDFTRKVILERKAEFDAKEGTNTGENEKPENDGVRKKKRYAFLDMLLANAKADNSMTITDIQEEVDTFMFEGHDTTASGITFAIYQLATHKEFQQKLRDEIMAVIDANKPITIATINEMKYMDCFLKESQRFCTTVPMISRELMEDCRMGEYDVPKGVTINILSGPLHRDPTYFPNPDVFDPDRWANEDAARRHPFCYIPFSAGMRNCIGQKFAQLEEKVMLSRLLQAYNFTCSQTFKELNTEETLVMRPSNGLMIKITKI